jgi:hypothetical protein
MLLSPAEFCSLNSFSLAWRFKPPHCDDFPVHELSPLNHAAAARLHDSLQHLQSNCRLHLDRVDEFAISRNPAGLADWLRRRSIQPDLVLLSWDASTALQTTWSVFTSRWDDFWYPSSDDLTIVDHTMSFACLFAHDERAYFAAIPPAA